MSLRRVVASLVVLPLAVTAIAAEGGGACSETVVETRSSTDAYETCELQTWFQAADGFNNAGEVSGNRPTWSTEPPGSASGLNGGFAIGAADAVVSTADSSITADSAVFEGTFEGALDVMDVEINVVFTGYASTGNPASRSDFSLAAKLQIDGEDVFPALIVDDVVTEETSTPSAYRIHFAFTELAEFLTDFDLDVEGEHEIRLTLAPNYVNTQPVVVFAYGAEEADGGIVFNPAELDEEATTIIKAG